LNPQPAFSPSATSPQATVTVPNVWIVDFVWYDDSGPCSDTVSIEFVEVPVVSAGQDKDVCGNCALLEGTSGGYSGTWLANGSVYDDFDNPNTEACVAANGPTTFTWLETNWATTQSLTCSATDDVVITFWTLPTAVVMSGDPDSTGLWIKIYQFESAISWTRH
jgi:hypothetical protein